MVFFLSESEVRHTVASHGVNAVMDQLIAGVDAGFRAMATGGFHHSKRTGFVRENDLIEWMPVHDASGSFVLKAVSYFPDNPATRSLPTIGAMIARFDFTTGMPTEIVGGRLLTAMRTGAASAVASRYLAKPNSATLGLIGCGLQAVTQAHALSRLFPLTRIVAHDTNPDAAAGLVRRLAFLGIPVCLAPPAEVEAAADILCTATTTPVGAAPVVPGVSLRPHVHINAVGSDFPGKTELPPGLVQNAFITPDSREQARDEGECQSLTEEHLASSRCVDLEVIVAAPDRFASLQNACTVFDSTGIAMEDAVALNLICEMAREAGFGFHCAEGTGFGDPKDPYGSLAAKAPRVLMAGAV